MPSKLSVRIPIYNQPNLLKDCLQSLRNQNFTAFEVLLIDDCSTANYESVIKDFSDLKIKSLRNKKNLGALENMLNSLYYNTEEDYIMVMHEDDVLHPEFLQNSIKVLEQNPNIAFSITTLSFFEAIKNIDFNQIEKKKEIICNNKNEFIFNILIGHAVGFGSAIFRKSKLLKINFDFITFAEVGDRPFLAEICGNFGCAIIPDNSYFARLPIGKDTRWKKLNYKNVINLYNYYNINLPKKMNFENRKKIKIGFTHNFVENYNNLSHNNFYTFLKMVYILRKLKIISIKYLLLKSVFVRKIIHLIK